MIDDQLKAYPFHEGAMVGIAKSGNTFNHKKLWEALSLSSLPYNYYPRGRVDVANNGQAVIYLNPSINTESVVSQIKAAFGIEGEDFQVRDDHSEHYKCYLDDGWKADGSR
ncbi:hypothetical protein [Anaerotardibacter muris]|uniref:hypothetical protein n=1 Tax=Anaerotardibacter muris TaxID=2941505 RepID=UPI00203B058D|nr:hypothetical protein [Anaerotardibacter muris]